MKRFLFAALALSVLPGNTATAQTANATSGVDIIQPLSIRLHANGFQFGTIAPSATAAGTVRLYGYHQTECVNVTCLGGAREWRITVNGEANRAITLSVPSSFEVSNGEETMLISNIDIKGSGHIHNDVLNNNGSFDTWNSATLNVGQNQAPGAYTGSYVVTAEYQ